MTQDQKKLIHLFIAVAAVFFLGFAIWKLDLLKPNVSQSTLLASAANGQPAENGNGAKYDFGEISMARGNVSTTFLLKNDGSDPLKISEITTSCMCTTAEIDGKIFKMTHGGEVSMNSPIAIAPGETKEMLVTFDPNAHGPEAVGPIRREIYVHTNSSSTPHVTVSVMGNVVK